ncbi:MAG TPA: type II secretion system protein GspE, partial [bacterium]|nr:type II secretion system protein GspE [bacterium]
QNSVIIFQGKGCDKCYGTGYRGRIAIYEILRLTPQLKKMIITETSDIAVKEEAVRQGMKTLREQAVEKLKAGITSVDEVLTATMGEQ